MKRRTRRRDPGQSIVLIALIIAVLVGLVALSVDVGNAYAQQRAAQRAADAGVTDAMRTAILDGATSKDVIDTVVSSLNEHNVPFDASQVNSAAVLQRSVPSGLRGVTLTYLTDDQREFPVVETAPIPTNLRYIKLDLFGSERTNFTSLFGRDDLAVHARAYARQTVCYPFPIGIDNEAFTMQIDNDLKFNYSDENYRNLKGRRIFLRTSSAANNNAVAGNFAWLRWLGNNGSLSPQGAMAAALNGTGTAPDFEEDNWPSGNNGDFGQKPASYPNLPGIPSESDWIRGAEDMNLPYAFKQPGTLDEKYDLHGGGNNNNALEVAQKLEWHIKNRSVVNLPIYSKMTNAFGQGGSYYVDRFEAFMITGFGYDDGGINGNPAKVGAGWYLDLVRVGNVRKCVELIDGGKFADPISLRGNVQIQPVYNLGKSPMRDPLDMVIVLDASGSMNWTWDGKGMLSNTMYNDLQGLRDSEGDLFLSTKYMPEGVAVGKPFQCSATDVLALPKPCQSADAWSDYTDRRLYKAKTAIADFLKNFPWAAKDRAAVVTYAGYNCLINPNDPDATCGNPDSLAKGYPSDTNAAGALSPNIVGPGGVADLLINKAASANPGNSDPSRLYLTLGASPGALGLERAHQLMQDAPTDSPTGNRNRVVIFLTDGLLNVNLGGAKSVQETITANIGSPEKPINQAITEAEAIRNDATKPAKIFVVAMGEGYDTTGLDFMSSEAGYPYLQSSNDDENGMKDMLDAINVEVTTSDCDPRDEGWIDPQTERARDFDGNPLGDKIGFVTVKDSNGGLIGKFEIKESNTGQAEFLIPGLQPSSAYTLQFEIYYMGLDDQNRLYSTIARIDGSRPSAITVVMPSAGVTKVQTQPETKLFFTGSQVCLPEVPS